MKQLRYWFTLVFMLVQAKPALSQASGSMRIDPTFWWVGMKNPRLQLLVHSPGIAGSTATLAAYPGVTLEGVQKLESPNYLLLNLSISASAAPGQLKLEFKGKKKLSYSYELRARNTAPDRVQGINTSDFIYLLMPDRFANGDPTNDVVKGMHEASVNRGELTARHGGDLKGIEDHFDYLKELGVTTIWPTPLVENNQPKTSYHGYALTDYYKIDPRYGSNDDYAGFVQRAHQQGLKVVHDVVLNHMGSENYLFRDQPAKDWFNQWPSFTRSNYADAVLTDPHAAPAEREQHEKGWFDLTMPDVNQSNPLVATYLIQNFIWWVEYTGLDAFRIDTYPYSDRQFLMRFGDEVQAQFPRLGMVGECTSIGVAQQAYFARNILPPVDGFKSNLPGVLDFQAFFAITDAFTKEPGWNEGINKLYYVLQQDWLYEDATRNVVFLDNHDQSRFLSVVGEDQAKLRLGLAWLLTTRGIPQLYYGTEVLMKNFTNPDGRLREDFPGGWPGDQQNLFTAAGRTPAQQAMHDYVRTLAQYRRSHPVLQTGQLTQYLPGEGVYTYFRHNDKGEAVMVVLNSANAERSLDPAKYAANLRGFRSARDVATGTVLPDLNTLKVPAKTAWVLELQK
ncbi:glycoside hydrolase family 13 protein [Hymenobacter saemangeumensis]|uniref:Glycoside hydrolase family 13 protein n=1 Tax=Hymenobacter saemangeumensis TaxID=1084522 RepID=A0ABP8I5T6_9BACT